MTRSNPRSLLFFVIRDHLGTTPLPNLRNTLIQDLQRIWAGLNKPAGLEKSRIEDYFDFAFAALPHKILQPERFLTEVGKLGTRFREGHRDNRKDALRSEQELEGGVFLSEYHRRIPADGVPIYTEQIWEQIVNNKDLDLPTQQELMAQFRCDEISRESLIQFDDAIQPFENKQAEGIRVGSPEVLGGLGSSMRNARMRTLKSFSDEASRYHKGVYTRALTELTSKIDTRLKSLFQNQLSAAHKSGVRNFSDAVTAAVKAGQKKGSYDFATIVDVERRSAIEKYEQQAKGVLVEGAPFSSYKQELSLYVKDLSEVSATLRKDEMRRLATRVERWVRSRLSESIGLEFNALGSGRGGSGAPEHGTRPENENELWDRIWDAFINTVKEAESRFSDRAQSFDATEAEVEIGTWRLRRKSWAVLKAKVEEEMMEGNLLLKLRENFEDKFRYDDAGVPRIWRPGDDIEGLYTKARESTLALIPLLARFRLSRQDGALPQLEDFVGTEPPDATPADGEDLPPIGGVDEEEGASLEEEMTVLTEGRRQDVTARFKKTADAVFMEAKRGALGGITQVPLYFYGLLLALGWNEIVAGESRPPPHEKKPLADVLEKYCATRSISSS